MCFLLIAFLLAGNLFATAIQERDSARRSGEIVPNTGERSADLILLHTNDFHGALLPNNGQGGLAELSAFIKSVKASNANVLLVDAGDFNTGSALSNMFNAEPVIRGFNIMGYDAVTFGNHEFDGTLETLNAQIAMAEFPFVSSNIMLPNGSYLGGNRYIVKRYGNFSVGIFGITTLRTRSIASPDDSLVFLDELEAARETVDILRNTERVDIVIALTHMGNIIETTDHITSIRLAKRIEGIDIIVDGHSHSLFTEPRRAGDSWVVTANEMGKYLGYGKLYIQNGRLVDFSWLAVPIGPNAPPSFDPVPDVTEITAMLAPYIERGNAVLKEVIGIASDTFVFGNRLTRYQETALGNLITDANVWFLRNVSNMEIDFAFHNGGNMRAELPAGPITQERILTILPFENYLHVVSMTGSQLIELFDFIATISQGNGGFPQFSSDVRLTIDKTTGNGIIRDLTIGGEPVDPQRIYRLCTNDYILGGGDDYAPMLNATDRFNTSLLLSYAVNEYIRANGAVSPVVDGRMTIVGGVTP
jgi:5'-nucleotidase/UDP-sugar diphosphatase